MKQKLKFILVIIFVQAGLPLLESITSLLMTMLEAAKGYFSAIVANYNSQMRASLEPKSTTRTIGFECPEDEEEEDFDDEVL